MKRSKFTEAQIAFILRQAEEGTTVAEVCRRDDNTVRPHSAIGNQVPALLHLSVGTPDQLAVG